MILRNSNFNTETILNLLLNNNINSCQRIIIEYKIANYVEGSINGPTSVTILASV
jgi:hypothetical protein